MESSILLKNGLIITHGADDKITTIKSDLLIKGNKIAKIAPNLSIPEARVIDCTNKLIAPGFIDTHRHMWNTALKGRFANSLLLDYMYGAILQGCNYEPDDVFWGQLAGYMEAMDAGTTTVVDHAHMNYSPDHTKAAISATITSGARSFFAYCVTLRVASWSPFALNMNGLLEPWVMETLGQLAAPPAADGKARSYGANGRVKLGFAFDHWFLPKEYILPVFAAVKGMGIELLTTHYLRGAISGPLSVPEILSSHDLLTPHTLLSHAGNALPSDSALIRSSGAHISSTPSVEISMGLNSVPACLDPALDVRSHCSLGVDCHTATSAYLPGEMRTALLAARGKWAEGLIEKGKVPGRTNVGVEEVYNLGTIAGARAVGMEALIGSLAEEKLADVLVYDMCSPGMLAAAQEDAVAAIVMHSSARDVEMVIVDGVIRKEKGKLLPVKAGGEDASVAGYVGAGARKQGELSWEEVAGELLRTREAVLDRIEKIDFDEARKGIIAAFKIDETNIV